MTTAAIMQPTYLPWLGYFALMDRVDVFVYLDSVQFARRSWQQRNRIRCASGPLMLTVPVLKKGLRDQTIADVEILDSKEFPEPHIRAIEINYAAAPYYPAYAQPLFNILRGHDGHIGTLTIAVCDWLAEAFGIGTRRISASSLPQSGAKADLLVDICQQIGCTRYVSPPGSHDYLAESSAFDDAGIELRYHLFQHPEYSQRYSPFVPYLSAIDLLFNEGPRSLAVIRSGTRPLSVTPQLVDEPA